MPAYVVGEFHITDPVAYRTHVSVALATVARFGGRIVAGGGKIELLGWSRRKRPRQRWPRRSERDRASRPRR